MIIKRRRACRCISILLIVFQLNPTCLGDLSREMKHGHFLLRPRNQAPEQTVSKYVRRQMSIIFTFFNFQRVLPTTSDDQSVSQQEDFKAYPSFGVQDQNCGRTNQNSYTTSGHLFTTTGVSSSSRQRVISLYWDKLPILLVLIRVTFSFSQLVLKVWRSSRLL